MGALMLTDLADVARSYGGEEFYQVVEVDGWKTRARGSGGFPGRVKGVSRHHDAGGVNSDGWPAVNFETFTSPNAPVCSIHIDRQSVLWVCAAGATNTIGKGGPMGDFALNDGNAHQIGIEMGNNGLGEKWPDKQVRAGIELEARLWIAYNKRDGWKLPLHPDQFFDHRRWAPGRKIDRKGEAGVTIDGKRYQFATGYSYWDTDLYNTVVTMRINQLLAPPTPAEPVIINPNGIDPMKKYILKLKRNLPNGQPDPMRNDSTYVLAGGVLKYLGSGLAAGLEELDETAIVIKDLDAWAVKKFPASAVPFKGLSVLHALIDGNATATAPGLIVSENAGLKASWRRSGMNDAAKTD